MSDDPRLTRVSAALDVRYLRDGLATLVIPLEPRLAELIGLIIAQWGGFEARVNALIKALHTAMGKLPPDHWERLGFRRRKELLKDAYREYLPLVGWESETPLLDSICGNASDLHWRRNVIAHGFYRYFRPPENSAPDVHALLVAFGTHKNRDVQIDLTEDVLSKLFHDIAHLNGELMRLLARRGVSIDIQEIVIEDKWLLQDQEHGKFQTVPMPDKREPSPRS